MKFLLDMGIPPSCVDFLTDQGHEAVHLRALGLHKLTDQEILEKSRVEYRVLVAHDLDFGDLLAASGEALPSVITFRVRDMRHTNVNRYLERILARHLEALDRGAILSITEGRIRVRMLPIRGH